MNKNCLLGIVALLFVCCTMLGCKKDKTTTIYGTVINSVTHEPVVGAQIEVGYRSGHNVSGYYWSNGDHRISSSVSGSDGQFELLFGEVQIPEDFRWYYIYGTATGYAASYQLTGVVIGGNYRMDINLEPY